MSTLEILLIAFSLSLDVAVVTVGATALTRMTFGNALKIALLFGVFHTVMPLIGWGAASWFGGLFSAYGKIISFGLLLLVGLKMLKDAFGPEHTEEEQDILRLQTLLLIALATSIDALVIGVSFTFLAQPIMPAALIIGLVTVLMSLLGAYVGHRTQHLLGTKVDALGGVILILLAFKTLFF